MCHRTNLQMVGTTIHIHGLVELSVSHLTWLYCTCSLATQMIAGLTAATIKHVTRIFCVKLLFIRFLKLSSYYKTLVLDKTRTFHSFHFINFTTELSDYAVQALSNRFLSE